MLSLVSVRVPLADATHLLVTHGGAESNTCVGLVRLGLRAAWVSRLGTDAAGDRVLSELERAGIDLRWVRRDPGRATGLMLRETSGAPPRYERGGSAASALSPSDLEGSPFEHARAVLVTGIAAMLGDAPRAAAIALLDGAKGLRVVDPNLRPGLWGSARPGELILPLLERADLVLGGEAELAALVGGTDRELAERCLEIGPSEVVVKRGSRGAAVAGADGSWIEQGGSPGPDVDPVGAGDAFNAGYLAARLLGRSMAEALEQGARCGAGVAGHVGDTSGFPTLEETGGSAT